MSRGLGRAAAMALTIAAAAVASTSAVPAAAQQYSDGYTFLKAVKDRDGSKATSMVSVPGTTVINVRDGSSGEGALHMLVRDRDITWLSFLVGKGARVDLQNGEGETPLSLAAQIGWIEGADLLLSHRASVDLANQRGETPLILAVHRRDLAMVRLLVASGASPARPDRVAGYSALDYARQDPRAAPLLHILEARPAAAGVGARPHT